MVVLSQVFPETRSTETKGTILTYLDGRTKEKHKKRQHSVNKSKNCRRGREVIRVRDFY